MNASQKVPLQPYSICISVTLLAATIVFVGSLAHVAKHQWLGNADTPLVSLLSRLDIVNEPSLIQWFSSSLHFTCSFLLFVTACHETARWLTVRWTGLALIFLFASIDEAIMIHEMLDAPTRGILNTSGFLAIAWIIPGTAIAVAIAAAYLTFLARLEATTRNRFVFAAIIFLTGAILMEIPGGWLYEQYAFTTSHYVISYAIEEFLEILGMAIFLFALLDNLGRNHGGLKLPIVTSQKRPVAVDPHTFQEPVNRE